MALPGVGATVIGAEAVIHLGALAGEAQNVQRAVLYQIAESAVEGRGKLGIPDGGTIRDRWPRGTDPRHPRSASLWYAQVATEGAIIGNTAPYSQFVWENVGFPDYWRTVIEDVLSDLQPRWEAEINQRVMALVERGATS